MQELLTPVMENLSVRVASTGAFGGLLSGSMEAFGTFTGAACLPEISCSDISAKALHCFGSDHPCLRPLRTTLQIVLIAMATHDHDK